MKKKFIFAIAMGAALLMVFTIAFAQYDKPGDKKESHKMKDDESAMMDGHKMIMTMADQSETMKKEFEEMQKHVSAMSDIDDCDKLKAELDKHQSNLMEMDQLLAQHYETGQKVTDMLNGEKMETDKMKTKTTQTK